MRGDLNRRIVISLVVAYELFKFSIPFNTIMAGFQGEDFIRVKAK
jgi:hypothetical protein